MIIKQLSVFVENKKGRLQAITQVLAENDIDISALSLADTEAFGVLRLIVNKPEEAKAVLNAEGVVVKITDVLAVVMDDRPGGVAGALKVFFENDISVEYMYACVGKTAGKALMIVKADDNDKAEEVLSSAGYALANPADIYRI